MYHDRDTVNEAASNYTADHSTDRNANFLADCAATILEKFAAAKSASRKSLSDLREVGERLNEAKEALAETKGGFGKWCEAFPFDKVWRARLMKLAANWDAIIEAVEALPEDRRKWSVDGVLAIFAAAEKAKAGPSGDGEGGEGEGADGEPKAAKAKKETEAERLRRELAEALEAIAALKAQVENLKAGQAKGRAREEKPREEAPKAKPNPGTVDAATKARARKVWPLYRRPGTEGEGTAARGRLETMAAKCGMDFDAFVAACGLN